MKRIEKIKLCYFLHYSISLDCNRSPFLLFHSREIHKQYETKGIVDKDAMIKSLLHFTESVNMFSLIVMNRFSSAETDLLQNLVL